LSISREISKLTDSKLKEPNVVYVVYEQGKPAHGAALKRQSFFMTNSSIEKEIQFESSFRSIHEFVVRV